MTECLPQPDSWEIHTRIQLWSEFPSKRGRNQFALSDANWTSLKDLKWEWDGVEESSPLPPLKA